VREMMWLTPQIYTYYSERLKCWGSGKTANYDGRSMVSSNAVKHNFCPLWFRCISKPVKYFYNAADRKIETEQSYFSMEYFAS